MNNRTTASLPETQQITSLLADLMAPPAPTSKPVSAGTSSPTAPTSKPVSAGTSTSPSSASTSPTALGKGPSAPVPLAAPSVPPVRRRPLTPATPPPSAVADQAPESSESIELAAPEPAEGEPRLNAGSVTVGQFFMRTVNWNNDPKRSRVTEASRPAVRAFNLPAAPRPVNPATQTMTADIPNFEQEVPLNLSELSVQQFFGVVNWNGRTTEDRRPRRRVVDPILSESQPINGVRQGRELTVETTFSGFSWE
jgi:hypothetical protein